MLDHFDAPTLFEGTVGTRLVFRLRIQTIYCAERKQNRIQQLANNRLRQNLINNSR